jgi:hypothetical protein
VVTVVWSHHGTRSSRWLETPKCRQMSTQAGIHEPADASHSSFFWASLLAAFPVGSEERLLGGNPLCGQALLQTGGDSLAGPAWTRAGTPGHQGSGSKSIPTVSVRTDAGAERTLWESSGHKAYLWPLVDINSHWVTLVRNMWLLPTPARARTLRNRSMLSHG